MLSFKLRYTLLTITFAAVGNMAQAVMYDVNLSGTGEDSGHTVSVSGTIDFDMGTDTYLGSSLSFTHGSDPAIALTEDLSVGNDPAGPQTNLNWVATPTELRVVRLTSTDQYFKWNQTSGPSSEIGLGAGTNTHYLFTFIDFSDNDLVVLKSTTGPDGPLGFLVGTYTPPAEAGVPEPSTLTLAALGFLVLIRRRRRK